MKNEIVVGLDDSPSGKAALGWAAEQAKRAGAALRAVHVLDWPSGLSAVGFPAPSDFMYVRSEELDESYRQAITAVFDAVSPRPDWVLQFASGEAGQILVRQSSDARLLVVGTREHVGLGRLLTGSVSHYCLSHAVCPVVAVPVPASDHSVDDSDKVKQATDVGIGRDGTSVTLAEDRTVDEPGSSGASLLVAGIDGSAESLAAAHYAVDAARMRGGGVLLVHAFAQLWAQASDRVAALGEARTAAKKLLEAVVKQLIVPPRVCVQTRAESGDAVAVLKESTQKAAILVVGRDHVSSNKQLFMGAVASQLASEVACPLVIVPARWRARHAWPPLPVIVALDGETAPEPALKLAFEEARVRDVRLIVLHAEPMNAPAANVTAARQDLGAALAEWEHNHPEVAVSTEIVSGDPDAQLIRWSRSASVLIVGHPHQRRWGSWTRSVARTVMRQTHCPLMVAPQIMANPEGYRTLADHAVTRT